MGHINYIRNRTPLHPFRLVRKIHLDIINILQHTEILGSKLKIINSKMVSVFPVLTNQDCRQRVDDNVVLNLDHNLIFIEDLRCVPKQEGGRKCHKRLPVLEYPLRILRQEGNHRIRRHIV